MLTINVFIMNVKLAAIAKCQHILLTVTTITDCQQLLLCDQSLLIVYATISSGIIV